jgi:hypothetical protein
MPIPVLAFSPEILEALDAYSEARRDAFRQWFEEILTTSVHAAWTESHPSR